MRVKAGFTRKRHHNKILKANKGYRMSKHRLFKVAQEAYLHAGQYAWEGRRKRKNDFRRLWIIRIKAALLEKGLHYNTFMHALQTQKIELDRKILSHLASDHPEILGKIMDHVSAKIN